MKARPIPFNDKMIQALLEGRKTITRRILKPQPSNSWTPYSYGDVHKIINGEPDLNKIIGWGASNYEGDEAYKCRYGKPGDLLWCKETFLLRNVGKTPVYKADMVSVDAAGFGSMYGGWKSPRYMPKWASRIILKIIDIKVEKLQDISEKDAIEEGIDRTNTSIQRYQKLWESINGQGSWDANPYVWAISFKVHKCNVDSFIKDNMTKLTESEKAHLKNCISIARISGLSKGLEKALAWPDFSKEGTISIANEITELADKFLEKQGI